MKRKVFEYLATCLRARKNSIAKKDDDWQGVWETRIDKLIKNHLPSGSGIDSGCKLHYDDCSDDKIIIETAFHHMNDGGYYSGWTEHKIILRPAFVGGFDIDITGRDKNQIKDYLYDTFYHALNEEIDIDKI